MGITKSDFFSVKQNEVADMLKALGHPARIAIVEHLLKTNSCICGDIVEVLPLAQATVSQHMKALKSAGLIKGNTEGNAICYCIDEKSLVKLQSYFGNFTAKLEKNKCC